MATPDLFGLKREQLITESGIRNIFTPHKPIHSLNLFFGRDAQVRKLIEQINTPGQHALLYGDRGVGKSSLANVTAELVLRTLVHGKLYAKRCDSQDTFETILAAPLKDAGFDIAVSAETKAHKQGGGAGLQVPGIAKGDVSSSREHSISLKPLRDRLSPSFATEALKGLTGLLVIDEADAIRTAGDKRKVAEFIKLLSDSGASFKVLVVGVAQTAEDLTDAHPSVQRCLKETKLERMSSPELRQIIESGAKKAHLNFQSDVISSIIKMSSGYPHFTHLLALKCAEDAIAEGRNEISRDHLDKAVERAVEDAEETLRRAYENAARSSGTDMYRKILCAAASIDKQEFTASELRDAVAVFAKRPIQQTELNNYYQRLISNASTTILRRISKGVYRFNDPRIPSFIRIASHQL